MTRDSRLTHCITAVVVSQWELSITTTDSFINCVFVYYDLEHVIYASYKVTPCDN